MLDHGNPDFDVFVLKVEQYSMVRFTPLDLRKERR